MSHPLAVRSCENCEGSWTASVDAPCATAWLYWRAHATDRLSLCPVGQRQACHPRTEWAPLKRRASGCDTGGGLATTGAVAVRSGCPLVGVVSAVTAQPGALSASPEAAHRSGVLCAGGGGLPALDVSASRRLARPFGVGRVPNVCVWWAVRRWRPLVLWPSLRGVWLLALSRLSALGLSVDAYRWVPVAVAGCCARRGMGCWRMELRLVGAWPALRVGRVPESCVCWPLLALRAASGGARRGGFQSS